MAKINLKFALTVVSGSGPVSLVAGVQDVSDEVVSAISPHQLAPLPDEDITTSDAAADAVPAGIDQPAVDAAQPADTKQKKK